MADHEKVLYPQKQQKNENNSTLHAPRIDSLQMQIGSSKQLDSQPELKLSDSSLNSFRGASIFTSQSPGLQIRSSQIELGQDSISAPSKALTTMDFEQTNERANFKAIKNAPAAENLRHELLSVHDEQEQIKQETKQATLLENNNYKPNEEQAKVADSLYLEVSAEPEVSKSAILLAEIDPEDLNKDQIDEALIVDAAAQEAAEQIFFRREFFIEPEQFAEAEQEQKEDEAEVFNQQQNEEEEMSKVQSLSIPITPTNPDELQLSSSVPSVSPSNKILAVKTFDALELDMKVKRLFTLISEGEFRIGSREKEVVLIVGLSEEGKSTMADEFSGKELSAVKVKGAGRWLITPTGKTLEGFSDSGRISPIGNERRSETTVPYKFKVGNKTIYDTPGIDDNRGMEQEIANSYYIKRIIDQSDKIKVMLTLNHSKI